MTRLVDAVLHLMGTQFFRFCCIGVVNTIIHGSIVIAAVELAGLGSTLANVMAFFVANLFSYVCNTMLTFRSDFSWSRYVRFFGSSLAVLGSTILIAGAGELLGVHYLIATICLMIVSPIFSFLLVRRFAFGTRT